MALVAATLGAADGWSDSFDSAQDRSAVEQVGRSRLAGHCPGRQCAPRPRQPEACEIPCPHPGSPADWIGSFVRLRDPRPAISQPVVSAESLLGGTSHLCAGCSVGLLVLRPVPVEEVGFSPAAARHPCVLADVFLPRQHQCAGRGNTNSIGGVVGSGRTHPEGSGAAFLRAEDDELGGGRVLHLQQQRVLFCGGVRCVRC